MEEICNIFPINNIKCNSVADDIFKNKKLHINKSLSIPHSSIIYNNNNNQNTPAVNFFDHSAKALGMSSRRSVTNGKVGQPAKRAPVLSNADSGATGNYIRLADINVLRDVRVSTQQSKTQLQLLMEIY